MPDDDIVKTLKITNNSGVDLVVTIPAPPGETFAATSKISCNKDLEVLATQNGFVIPQGQAGTVTLDHTSKNVRSGLQTYVTLYDIECATSDTYMPFFMADVELNDDTGAFDDLVVPPEGLVAAKETLLFYQGVSALPNTKLAQDYVAALSKTGSVSSPGKLNAVDTYFKGTKQYTHVTMGAMHALEDYLNRFPFAWANNGNITYYLYSADGKTCRFEGTLALAKPATIDVTAPNGGYTCRFNPAATPTDLTSIAVNTSAAKTMTYEGGLFMDDVTSDMPAISLKGSYQVKRTFTKADGDNIIIPVMSGTINGVTALGFDGSQATTPDDTTQDWLNTMFHPKTAAEIWNSVMQILGALMMLHFVGGLVWGVGKWIRKQRAAKDPPTDQEIETEKSSLFDRMKAEIKTRYDKLRGNKDADLPADSQDAVNKAAAEKANLSDEVSAAKAQTNIRTLEDTLKDVKPYAETDDQVSEIDSAASDLSSSYRSINNSEASDLRSLLDSMKAQMEKLTTNVKELSTEIQQIAANKEVAEVNDAVESANKVQSDMEEESASDAQDETDAVNDDPPFEGFE